MKNNNAENKVVIIDNYYLSERFDDAKRFLFEEMNDDKKWECMDDVSDDDVFEELNFQEENDWDNFKYEMKEFMDNSEYGFLVVGSIGRWDGRYDGGSFVSSFDELAECWQDCDYIEVTDVNGHLYISCSHHDGTNNFEVKELTEKGYEVADKHDFDRDRKLHNTIFNTNFYSRLPKFANRVYGCRIK